jgi:hypothetical protein
MTMGIGNATKVRQGLLFPTRQWMWCRMVLSDAANMSKCKWKRVPRWFTTPKKSRDDAKGMRLWYCGCSRENVTSCVITWHKHFHRYGMQRNPGRPFMIGKEWTFYCRKLQHQPPKEEFELCIYPVKLVGTLDMKFSSYWSTKHHSREQQCHFIFLLQNDWHKWK